MPDLNQLPPSPQPHLRTSGPSTGMSDTSNNSQDHSPSPASHSLAATAALNSTLVSESQDASCRPTSNGLHTTPSAQRRRSSIRMNLNLNDPSLPSSGELAMSPGGIRAHPSHSSQWPPSPGGGHQRTPSLGELHQELENEQEAQVNRLLSMIRQQQTQIQHLQSQAAAATPTAASSSAIAIDDGTPISERSVSLNHSATTSQQNIVAHQSGQAPRSPFHLSRHSSYRSGRSSRDGSPSIRPMSAHGLQGDSAELLLGPASVAMRDDSAFYQAETATLTRENQMLKQRIRELERQLTDTNSTSPIAHSPMMASNLHRPPLGTGDTEPTSLPLAPREATDTSKD